MALHVAESPDEELFMREGKGTFADSLRERGIPWNHPAESTISYLNELGVLERSPLLIHCVQADERDLQLIAASRSRIAHCPKSNAKLGHGIAPINRALSMGIRIGLGTDSVASNNNCDLIEEARFGVLLHRARGKSAIDARQALRMMTIESARALDLDGVCGSLEAGKQADVIAIDLSSVHNTPHYDPVSAVIDSCSGRDCILTIVAGKVLFEGGTVETIDEERTLLEASAAAASLRT